MGTREEMCSVSNFSFLGRRVQLTCCLIVSVAKLPYSPPMRRNVEGPLSIAGEVAQHTKLHSPSEPWACRPAVAFPWPAELPTPVAALWV
jgi:hypothetical protein